MMDNKNKVESRLEAMGSELRSRESVVSDVMKRIDMIPDSAAPVRKQRDAMIWRLAMNKYAKIAAAAAILIVALVVTVTILEKSTAPAYALDQTVTAFQLVKFVHVTDWEVGKEEPMQIWMEYGADTEPVRIRFSMPEWKNPLDGPKEAIWAAGIAQVYMPKKNVFVTVAEKRIVREMRDLAGGLDAGDLFRKMVQLQASGKRSIQISEPSGSQDKIVVTSTGDGYTKKFYVDPTTKLLSAMETCTVDDKGNETLQYKMDCDYVRPENDVFTLTVPDTAMKVDMATRVVGIPQGDMTDTQVAAQCVSQFWQALMDQDYQKAGGIYSGIAAETLEKAFGQTRVTKVVSMGEPVLNPTRPGVYDVSCTVEFSTGSAVEQKTMKVYVRKGDDQAHPDRWMIIGGI
jgi:hypothetical protein